jgi:nitroreductase
LSVPVFVPDLDLFPIIERQRACRAYRPDPVDDADIARVLRAATFAPSAENRQPWEFVVVRDEARRKAIAGLMQRAWEAGGRAHSDARLAPHVLRDVDTAMTGGFAGAPVQIVVCVNLERGSPRTIGSSIFPAVQNLLLAATALGLGSALTTIATAFAEELASVLDLPEHVRAVAVVPLGHPVRPLGPPRRESFTTHTHRDTFGTAW